MASESGSSLWQARLPLLCRGMAPSPCLLGEHPEKPQHFPVLLNFSFPIFSFHSSNRWLHSQPQRSRGWIEMIVCKQPGAGREDAIRVEHLQPGVRLAVKSGGLSPRERFTASGRSHRGPVSCDVSIRCSGTWLDTEQSRFLKGVRDPEPSWLTPPHVCAGDQEACGGKAGRERSWRGGEAMGAGSCLRGNLAHILYLCLFSSGNGMMCWREASGCCQRYEHLGCFVGKAGS